MCMSRLITPEPSGTSIKFSCCAICRPSTAHLLVHCALAPKRPRKAEKTARRLLTCALSKHWFSTSCFLCHLWNASVDSLLLMMLKRTIFHYLCLVLGPFTQAVTSHMSLKNPTDRKILFKIKTTAPKKYCVRPNCGAIDPRTSVEIASKSSLASRPTDSYRFSICSLPPTVHIWSEWEEQT